MTKENNLNNQLAIIEKTLQEIESCRTFLKDEPAKIDAMLKIAFELWEKQKDKGGFLRLLFKYSKTEGWKKSSIIKDKVLKYFQFCDIDFHFLVSKQKLFLDYEKENIIPYLDFLAKSKAIEKENRENTKENLLQVKLPFTLAKLTSEQLNACIIQAKKVLKDLEKKEKQN